MAKSATVYSFIVTSIVSLLGLDDASKLEKFFNGEVKKFNTEIKKLKANIKNFTLKREIEVEEHKDQLEDAEQVVADAYLAVKVDDISTNADAKSFSKDYWSRIGDAQTALESLIENDEQAAEAYKERVEDTNEQIGKYQTRIDKLTQKV